MDAEKRKTAMSHDEMQDYWKTLCSFTGEDIPNEVNQLMAKIRYPRFLYKYRAVNNNNLDALRSNKLFFSKASSYDDPFDTFLHIDVEKIRQEFDSNYSSPEALAALANGMKETFQNQPGVPQEFIQQVTNVEGLKQLFLEEKQEQKLRQEKAEKEEKKKKKEDVHMVRRKAIRIVVAVIGLFAAGAAAAAWYKYNH